MSTFLEQIDVLEEGIKSLSGADISHWEALEREIKEELSVEIIRKYRLGQVFYEYDDFVIELNPYICKLGGGEITLNEHQEIKWGKLYQLGAYDVLPADIKVLEKYLRSRMSQ